MSQEPSTASESTQQVFLAILISDDEHENFVVVDQLATSAVNMKVYFWVDTTDFRRIALITKGEVIKNVKEALEQGGYSILADIQEIKLYWRANYFPARLESAETGNGTKG